MSGRRGTGASPVHVAAEDSAPHPVRLLGRQVRFAVRHPLETLRFVAVRDRPRWEAVKLVHNPYSQPLKDLAAYRGSSLLETAMLAGRGPGAVAESWSAHAPRTRAEIEEWHRRADAWLADLAWWNTQPMYSDLLGRLQPERDGVCLVFGGGIGGEAMRLSAQGNEVWFCDLPGTPMLEFAAWRAERHGFEWRFVSEVPEAEAIFDCATAFNVFGSLPAEALAQALSRIAGALKPGAKLYCNHDWRERADHPYIHDHETLWHRTVAELPLEVTLVNRGPKSGTKHDFCVLEKQDQEVSARFAGAGSPTSRAAIGLQHAAADRPESRGS